MNGGRKKKVIAGNNLINIPALSLGKYTIRKEE